MKRKFHVLAVLLMLLATLPAAGVNSSFTYNGHLTGPGGTDVNGNFDIRLTLYDDARFGNVVSGPKTNLNVSPTHGVFTTSVDVGGPEVFTGDPRWLEVAVRPSSGGSFDVLSPRQEITSTPYAQKSAAPDVLGNAFGLARLQTPA